MGLGLAIVRALTEAHGGQLAIQSTPGAGTVVTLRLPLRAQTAAAA
jgi:signal transduction histidine kinase